MMPVPYVSINPSKKREVQVVLTYNLDMKIYVIGNGFDIAHGLKTSYADYLLYIKEHANKDNGWGIILEYYPKDHEFWSDAETNICNINRQRFLEPKRAFPDFCDLDVLLRKIRESFAKFILEVESHVADIKPKFTLDRNAIYITFNYTDVLEEVYKIPNNKVIHLHNSVYNSAMKYLFNIDADEIVLGHGPNYRHFVFWADQIIGNDKDYISFRNNTLKNTSSIIAKYGIQEILLRIQKYVDEVVFYGFSFSPNDQEYVQTIAMCLPLPITKYKLYYFVKDGEIEENVIERFTNNMIKCAFDINKTTMINCKDVLAF
ncbi:bacteriophage abortive infection AbiH family protein [bacterium]|nr:bacteriophage abortive infection AbiH family protein [bacterium]